MLTFSHRILLATKCCINQSEHAVCFGIFRALPRVRLNRATRGFKGALHSFHITLPPGDETFVPGFRKSVTVEPPSRSAYTTVVEFIIAGHSEQALRFRIIAVDQA